MRTGGSRPLLDEVLDEIAEIKADAAAGDEQRPMADDRVPHPQGLDRPGLHRRQEDRPAHGAPTRCRSPAPVTPPSTCRCSRDWLASYRADELFDEDGRLRPGHPALAPAGPAADERQPARQRRPAAQGPAPA